MKYLNIIAIASITISFLCGCRAEPHLNFTIQKRQITIITEPEGARVYQINVPGAGTTDLGTTPIENQPVVVIYKITRMENMPYEMTEQVYKRVGAIVVNIKKDGYEPYNGTLTTDPNEAVIHRVTLKPKAN